MATTFERLVTILCLKQMSIRLTKDDRRTWDDYHSNRRSGRFELNESKLEEYISIYNSTAVALEKFHTEHMQDAIHEEIEKPIQPRTGKVWKIIFRIAAAVLVIAGGGYYIYKGTSVQKEQVQPNQSINKSDLQPGSSRAILTLADGKKVTLDSSDSPDTTMQGNTTINFKQGQLVYVTLTSQRGSSLLYNTVETPKSGTYNIILPDGTKTWLNAASSIRFPVAFTGDERKVEITGEVYFEVNHQGSPFGVEVNGLMVRAFGTTFNINAYEDEKAIKTTLLEGKVTIERKNNPAITLKEGEQASITENANATTSFPDTEGIIAWKNGQFYGEDIKLGSLFRQIERWYDAKVDVQDKEIEEWEITFGPISRNVSVSTIFNYLRDAKHITYHIEGNNIIVKKIK